MDLSEIQKKKAEFERERGWDKFSPSLIFAHLIEELGEISRHITVDEGYKVVGLGHEAPTKTNLSREFAQVFSLFIQLANYFKVDLEKAVISELELMRKRFPVKEWSEHMRSR
ncbi:MAG: MazG-like family protein [Candidatus Thorarchaeota archaeon]|nr:MAG: MazG-like family protein [Candidatus Thorarchaeota archaeon]